jgi:UDP:flavonoid glycosyltransferase YjiC (YdhE family)
LGPHWHNLQASVRTNDSALDVPEKFQDSDELLIYLSMGSLGSADVDLMRKLIAELADTPYRIVVSKGPRAKELDLADNMAGAEFLPQTSILPKVDLVITRGGNNTVTESLYFGKAMIVLPIFWDQHDNAQRLDESGLGVRLDTYGHEPGEMTDVLGRLLDDGGLRADASSNSRPRYIGSGGPPSPRANPRWPPRSAGHKIGAQRVTPPRAQFQLQAIAGLRINQFRFGDF